MRLWALIVASGAVACSPAPRDAEWFAVHAAEAERVARTCAAGHRIHECENARTGLARAQADLRRDRYRRGFE